METMASKAIQRIGLIGAGQMATALARGMVARGVVEPSRLAASDPAEPARRAFAAATGAAAFAGNAELVAGRDVLVLAVKPQAMSGVLAELRELAGTGQLVVSVAAGLTLERLRAGLGPGPRLARVMPNTPALLGAGASAYCFEGDPRPEDETLVRTCVEAVGLGLRVAEAQMDAVTGLSGSGPAYVYQVIEALADGGVRVGLTRGAALALAAQTVLGAARMVLETGEHPAVLKDRVASPGGTTIAGLHALERGGLRAALMDAVEASARRSSELSG
jgi:pyrroline-5-carboxylate reductase